jgi:ATP-dependent protease ClpP protease subunit
MRNIPGLTSEVVARASQLASKTREARAAVKPVESPTASIPSTKVEGGTLVIRLYDYIDSDGGYWGISADEFAQAIDNAEEAIDHIELRINSGGGSVWDGLALLNTLRDHPAPVKAIVDGVAASAASFIAVACDEVVMMPNSRLMIHDALAVCAGQAVDMRECADFLDDTSDNIAEIYATKAGGTTAEWRTTMTAKGLMGQWYSAQEAVDAGLADRVGGADAPENRAPSEQAPSEPTPAPSPAPAPEPPAAADYTAKAMARRQAENARKHGMQAS